MLAPTTETLNQLLDEELAAIVAHDAEQLARITAEKADVIAAIEALGAAHDSLSPEKQSALAECKRRNLRNGTVLHMRRRHADAVLRIIHAIPETSELYNADGSSRSLETTRYNTRA